MAIIVLIFSLVLSIPAQATQKASFEDLLQQLLTEQEQPAQTTTSNASTSSLPSGEVVAQLRTLVGQYLDSQGYSYSFNDERSCFNYSMRMDSMFGNCDVSIFIRDNGFKVYAYSPITPKPDNPTQLAATAEYLHRANYGLNLGYFEMDHEDGEVRYKTSFLYKDRMPSMMEVEWYVDYPPILLESYVDGLGNVLFGGANPAAEIQRIEGN